MDEKKPWRLVLEIVDKTTRYIERTAGSYKHSSDIIECMFDRPIDVDMYGNIDAVDIFHSVFMFDYKMDQRVKEHGTIASFDDEVYTSYLHFDFDSADDPSESLRDVRKLIDRLDTIGVDVYSCCKVYYSGSKGMHVFVLNDDIAKVSGLKNTNSIVKFVCSNLADGLKTFDTSVYDKVRLIRCANSKHSKTGRYKIPMTVSEAQSLSMDEIIEMSSEQRDFEYAYKSSCNDYIADVIKEYTEDKKAERLPSTSKSSLIDGIANGFAKGSINTGLTSVAGMLHTHGLSDDIVSAVIASINSNSEGPLEEKYLDTIVKSVSRYKIKQEYQPIADDDIVDMHTAYAKWKESRLRAPRIKSGYDMLDPHLFTFDEGKVMMVAARAGIGKTNWGLQVANTIAESIDGEALFCSLEMSRSAIFYRAARIEGSYDMGDESNEEFTGFLLENEQICNDVCDRWDRIKIVDKDGLNISQIETYLKKANEMSGGRTKVLLVDYVGLISGTEDYKGLSEVAREFKNVAKRNNVRIVILVQLSRAAGDGSETVRLDHLRGSGSLEEAADIIIGMWRSTGDERRVHVIMLKNRDGERGVKFDLLQKCLVYANVPYDDSMDVENVAPSGQKRFGKR